MYQFWFRLTHWGRVTHICVGKLTIIAAARRQAIIWTNAGILLIWPLGTNFSEILIGIQNIFVQENALENVVCQMASICLSLNVLNNDTLMLSYGRCGAKCLPSHFAGIDLVSFLDPVGLQDDREVISDTWKSIHKTFQFRTDKIADLLMGINVDGNKWIMQRNTDGHCLCTHVFKECFMGAVSILKLCRVQTI